MSRFLCNKAPEIKTSSISPVNGRYPASPLSTSLSIGKWCQVSSVKCQVKSILSTQIKNSPPLVPGTGSSRRRQNWTALLQGSSRRKPELSRSPSNGRCAFGRYNRSDWFPARAEAQGAYSQAMISLVSTIFDVMLLLFISIDLLISSWSSIDI